MAKNIVICCDGTGNKFGAQNSNVIKLYRMLTHDACQITYYHPGVGTMGARNALSTLGKAWTKLIGLAFGYGLSDNIADAYQFLMRTYQPGDSVFVFGFSRGAYTARALCGMLHQLGLMTQGNEGQIPYAIRLIKSRHIDFDVTREFRKTFSIDCLVHFVGVWDTVSSVGWIYNSVSFPSTASNPDLKIVRHAISVDERRAFFRQNLFQPAQQQDVEQVWFPGVHSDVGGSYPEAESQLSKGALQWMVCEAENAGLKVDQQAKAAVMGGEAPYVKPDPATAYIHNSLRWYWWPAEFWPKLHRTRVGEGWKTRIRLNLGRRRTVQPGSKLHVSVEQRMNAVSDYRPSNLCDPAQLRTQFVVVGDKSQTQAATG